jgi:hypothetical protein
MYSPTWPDSAAGSTKPPTPNFSYTVPLKTMPTLSRARTAMGINFGRRASNGRPAQSFSLTAGSLDSKGSSVATSCCPSLR